MDFTKQSHLKFKLSKSQGSMTGASPVTTILIAPVELAAQCGV